MLDRLTESETAYGALTARDCRLLTLVGPGGVGKTRLAIAVGERLSASADGEVWFVDLTAIRDPDDLSSLVVATVGITVSDTEPLDALKRFLYDNPHTILILDNFEHVLGAALTVGDILDSCPDVRILATSREPLRLKWEHRLLVPPLPLPEVGVRGVTESEASPSVDLFMQRARAVNGNFAQSVNELRYVSEVCVRLDGMPLAIELAAARANVLTAEGIASRMGDTRSLLQNAVRDAPARHQSIQSMLDWSFGLLSPSEQEVFLRLGVFVGGFTLEATQAILGDASVSDALTALSALCDKGLVALAVDAGVPRYRLHEAVRAYASERLEAGDAWGEMRNRHADYYLRLAERENARFRHLSYLYTPLQLDEAPCQAGSRAWAEELAQDDGNLQSATAWLSSSSRPHHQLRLTSALQWFWWIRGQLDEGVRRLVDALENDDGSAKALRVDALCGLGILYRQSGQGESAATVLAEAVDLARELDDDRMLARSLSELATVDVKLGRLDEAESGLDAGIRAWLRTGDEWGAAMADGLLGSVAHLRGRTDEAVRRCRLAATEFLRLGDRRSAAVARYLGAAAALDQNDLAGARTMVLESLGAVDQLGEPNLTAAYLELSAWAIAPTAYGEDAARILGCAQSLRSGGFARVRQEELHLPACARSAAIGTAGRSTRDQH